MYLTYFALACGGSNVKKHLIHLLAACLLPKPAYRAYRHEMRNVEAVIFSMAQMEEGRWPKPCLCTSVPNCAVLLCESLACKGSGRMSVAGAFEFSWGVSVAKLNGKSDDEVTSRVSRPFARLYCFQITLHVCDHFHFWFNICPYIIYNDLA